MKVKTFSSQRELRRSVKYHSDKPSKTDQSQKLACDVNHIIAQYAKTGHLPTFPEKQQLFLDETQLPDFYKAHDIMVEAKRLFLELPSAVRKAMNNDPREMVEYLQDPKNKEFLVSQGVFEKQQPQEPSTNELLSDIKKAITQTEKETTTNS